MKSSYLLLLIAALFFAGCSKDDANKSAAGGDVGQGGSLARFTIASNHLYMVDQQTLYTYTLTDPSHPQAKGTVNIGISNIETIYAFKDKLFIGSDNAMYIYSIADADNPTRLGMASHVRACDPVVANDSIAYVTVRTGTTCGGNTNALLVYNIRNILNPTQQNVVPLSNPHGLGIKGNRLYVCNGADGLKTYNLTNPLQPSLIKTTFGETYYDVIVDNDILIAMVEGGTALYQINPNDNLQLLAKITN